MKNKLSTEQSRHMTPLSQMTPDEKRIAVAEFDGWKNANGVFYPPSLNPAMNIFGHKLPDYPNDRNAIVKAVKQLNETQQVNFVGYLGDILGVGKARNPAFFFATASAEQLTDALLLTIGRATLQ